MVTPRRAISFGEANWVIQLSTKHPTKIVSYPQSPSRLRCPFFQVSVTPDSSNSSGSKQCRMTIMDEDTKQAILGMSKPLDMDADERKRQYAAMSLGLCFVVFIYHVSVSYMLDTHVNAHLSLQAPRNRERMQSRAISKIQDVF